MPEILEQYAQILEKENSNAEFIGLLRQERASLLELESDYKVSFKITVCLTMWFGISRLMQIDTSNKKCGKTYTGRTE